MPELFEIDLRNNAAEECQNVLTGSRPLPLDICNKASQNALMVACAHGSQEVVEMLFTVDGTLDLDAVDADGWTALHHASQQGSEEILNILCKKGANPSLTTNNNETGLHLAAQERHKAVVKFLLEKNCPFDIQTTSPVEWKGGKTALHLALRKYEKDNKDEQNEKDEPNENDEKVRKKEKKEEISLILLQHGADVKLKDKGGKSALHFAAKRGMSKAVEKLIQQGADVNNQDSKFDFGIYFEGNFFFLMSKC
jgi:ankyrin repeat protein